MSKLKCIAIDVDLVLVDVIPKWHTYLQSLCLSYDAVRYKKDLQRERVDYNITHYYELPVGVDGMDFWRQDDLYDDATPIKHAVAGVEEIYTRGHDIVFVSMCYHEHTKSKINFLRRSFPFIHNDDFHFISTKSKGMVRCDVLVDDRAMFLNKMSDKTLCIKFHTPYLQCEEPRQHYITHNNWKDLLRSLV